MFEIRIGLTYTFKSHQDPGGIRTPDRRLLCLARSLLLILRFLKHQPQHTLRKILKRRMTFSLVIPFANRLDEPERDSIAINQMVIFLVAFDELTLLGNQGTKYPQD